MSEVTEQPAQADSETSIDAKLDRFFPSEEPQEETQQTAETPAAEQPAEEPVEAPADSEEEIEWEGLKLKLPKEAATKWKSTAEGYKDYTRKTQEVADARRMVELQQQQRQIEVAFQQAASQDLSEKAELEAALKQYKNVQWQTLDFETTMRTKLAEGELKERLAEVTKRLDGKQKEFEQHVNGVRNQLARQAFDALTRQVPKWSKETHEGVLNYGKSVGLSDHEVGQLSLDPRLVSAFYKAQQWDQLQAAKPLAAKRAAGVPPVVKPGATKPVASAQAQYADTVKQLHQAKDPERKKALLDKSLDLKLDRMFKR